MQLALTRLEATLARAIKDGLALVLATEDVPTLTSAHQTQYYTIATQTPSARIQTEATLALAMPGGLGAVSMSADVRASTSVLLVFTTVIPVARLVATSLAASCARAIRDGLEMVCRLKAGALTSTSALQTLFNTIVLSKPPAAILQAAFCAPAMPGGLAAALVAPTSTSVS
jgi:hypothetical protein